VEVGVDMFDRNPMLLNLLNGTLDLTTMRLSLFKRSNYITKLSPVTYVSGARSDIWLSFLKDIMPDPDTRSFLQAAAGYSLTAAMDEDKMFMLQGGGCNGKTTFTGALLNMLGDYGSQASSSTFTSRSSSGPSNDVFVLMGRRFVCATETDESHKLNEVLIKQMTGGDRVSVNPKYRSQIEFHPTWKIWLSTNHEPTITGGDDAIWRRIVKIPFSVKIAHPDRKLKPLLFNSLEERSGILNWALDGLRVWKHSGLIVPERVKAVTKWYRAEQDLTGQFIADKCKLHPNLTVNKRRLYTLYNDYCKGINQKPKSAVLFGKYLSQRGIKDTRTHTNRRWIGIDACQTVPLSPSEME